MAGPGALLAALSRGYNLESMFECLLPRGPSSASASVAAVVAARKGMIDGSVDRGPLGPAADGGGRRRLVPHLPGGPAARPSAGDRVGQRAHAAADRRPGPAAPPAPGTGPGG